MEKAALSIASCLAAFPASPERDAGYAGVGRGVKRSMRGVAEL